MAGAAHGGVGIALVDAGTWQWRTAIEKDDLIARARAKGEKIHLGDLMSICSIKFWECPREKHKYKGRICLRGDNVRDEEGALAVSQELSAHPTTIQDANANIAHGTLPGNDTEAADAIRAYIQSLLAPTLKK